MKTTRKVFAGLIIALSVLGLILSLLGVAGVWWVTGKISTSVIFLLNSVENSLTNIDAGLTSANTLTAEAINGLNAVDQKVSQMGTNVADNNLLLEAIQNNLSEDTSSKIASLREDLAATRQAAIAVQNTVKAIDALPFFSLNIPGMDKVQQLFAAIEDFGTQLQETRAAIQDKKAEIVGGVVTTITDRTAKFRARLENLQSLLTNAQSRIGQSITRVQKLKETVAFWLKVAAVVFSLVFLWIAFANLALMVDGVSWFKGESENLFSTTGRLFGRRKPALDSSQAAD